MHASIYMYIYILVLNNSCSGTVRGQAHEGSGRVECGIGSGSSIRHSTIPHSGKHGRLADGSRKLGRVNCLAASIQEGRR